MANTTLTNIQNTYRGAIDKFVPTDKQKDDIRRESVSNVIVRHIKKSNEAKNPLHSLGLIVVAKKEDATIEQYSVTRYWQNLYTTWLESEYLFDVIGGPYDDFYLFDDYAIVLKDKNKIKAIYFKDFKEKTVPINFEIPLYNDLQYTTHTFDAIAFENYSGRGNYRMIGAIRT